MRAIPMLLLAALSPLALYAQSTAPVASDDGVTPTVSAQVSGDYDSNGTPDSSAATADTASASPNAPAQQAKSPQKPRPKPEVERPPAEGSMVGYIDNAIVGNEVRIRFDAGFDNNRPDRAEFFYAQCGCDGPPAKGPGPGLVFHLNFQQLYMRAEYAPIKRFSGFVDVPIRWVQPQQIITGTVPPGATPFGNQSGISDVTAGFKFAAVATSEHYLTLQFSAAFPSGDSSKGLGTNHYTIQPEVLFYQKLGDRSALEAQLGDSHPINSTSLSGFAGDVFTYGIGPSYEVYRGENVRITPVIEMVGWRVIGGLVTNGDFFSLPGHPVVRDADGTNIVNLKAGFRTSIGNHNSLYIGYGQALTHEMWYKHIVRIEYRYTF